MLRFNPKPYCKVIEAEIYGFPGATFVLESGKKIVIEDGVGTKEERKEMIDEVLAALYPSNVLALMKQIFYYQYGDELLERPFSLGTAAMSRRKNVYPLDPTYDSRGRSEIEHYINENNLFKLADAVLRLRLRDYDACKRKIMEAYYCNPDLSDHINQFMDLCKKILAGDDNQPEP